MARPMQLPTACPARRCPIKASALIELTARLSSRDFNKASRLALGCWIVLLSPLTIDYASISSTKCCCCRCQQENVMTRVLSFAQIICTRVLAHVHNMDAEIGLVATSTQLAWLFCV